MILTLFPLHISLLSNSFSAKASVMYVLCDPESRGILTCSLFALYTFFFSAFAICMSTDSDDDERSTLSSAHTTPLISSLKFSVKCALETFPLNFCGHKLLW